MVRWLSVRFFAKDSHRTQESIADVVRKTFLHRLAVDNSQNLFVSEYLVDPAQFGMNSLALKKSITQMWTVNSS